MREPSIVGCFPELVLLFSVAKVLEGLVLQSFKHPVFPTWIVFIILIILTIITAYIQQFVQFTTTVKFINSTVKKVKGKLFYGQEPPSGESTTTEVGRCYTEAFPYDR